MVPGGKVIPDPLCIQFEIIKDFVFDGSDKMQLLICHISIMEVISVNLIIETLYIIFLHFCGNAIDQVTMVHGPLV